VQIGEFAVGLHGVAKLGWHQAAQVQQAITRRLQ